jgi:hypothetical protein
MDLENCIAKIYSVDGIVDLYRGSMCPRMPRRLLWRLRHCERHAARPTEHTLPLLMG